MTDPLDPAILAQILRQNSAPIEPQPENMQMAQSAGGGYGVFNGQTGQLISSHPTQRSANVAAYKLRMENGGHVYVPVRPIPLGPIPKG